MKDGHSNGRRRRFALRSRCNRSAQRSQCVRAIATITFGFMMLGAGAASWAAAHAHFDRDAVREGDALTLTIESDEPHSGVSPDLAVLRKDFDVLATSTSNEIRIINGDRSHLMRWLVQLRPRRTGVIDIAPITVGTEQTAGLTLTVTVAPPEVAKQVTKHVFVEVDSTAAGKSVYVQQQIPYTVRLYYDDTVKSGDLEPPDPANAIVEQVGEEQRYTAMHDGIEYKVLERRYAIAPQRRGSLVIPPASFHGTMVPVKKRSGLANQADDPIAHFLRGTPFSNDPFFKGRLGPGMSFVEAPQPVAVRGPEIRLNVQPRPATAMGNWLPAELITLHDSWDDSPPRLKVGEPVTRTVTIEAKGLAGAQIPPLSLAQPGNARLYPEAPENQSKIDGETIYGTSRQSVTYIPASQGTLDIAPVELAWWDTRNDVQRRAVLPGRKFNVESGAARAQSQPLPPSPSGSTPASNAATRPVTDGQPLNDESIVSGMRFRGDWIAAAAVVLLATLVLSVISIRYLRRPKSKSGQGATRPRLGTTMRALQQACAENNPHAAQSALLDLAQAEWPDDPPRSLGALANRLESGRDEINALDKCLYRDGGTGWRGDALWRILHVGLQPKRIEAKPAGDGLGALYAPW